MKYYNNDKIRRQDRILEEDIAQEIIINGELCILSMIETIGDELAGYGIPVNYVWDNDKYIYIHCAPEGHKSNCLDSQPKVSICIIGKTEVIPDKFTTVYQSVIIRGCVTRNLPEQERMKALELILKKYSPNDMVVGMKYAIKSFHRTEILRVEIETISGKTKRKNI